MGLERHAEMKPGIYKASNEKLGVAPPQPRPRRVDPAGSAKIVEEGGGERSHDAGGSGGGGNEYPRGVSALPGSERYSTGAGRAHSYGVCWIVGRRRHSRGGRRAILGFRAAPSSRIQAVFSVRIRAFLFPPIRAQGTQAGPAWGGCYATKASEKVRRSSCGLRPAYHIVVDAGPRSGDAAHRQDDSAAEREAGAGHL